MKAYSNAMRCTSFSEGDTLVAEVPIEFHT